MKRICVTGGSGYVGSLLVPTLLNEGYDVTTLDCGWYYRNQSHPRLKQLSGDIRNPRDLRRAFFNQDAVIHLACISNDPSFELNPGLGKSINYDAFAGILKCLKDCQIERFIYASSSSVYGVKEQKDVTEETECEPLTDYSKFKLMCEHDLREANLDACWTIIRPATVCGYAPRLRLDLIVNVLTINGLINKKIVVHGGNQLRPNLNIKDMVQSYLAVLRAPREKVDKEIFNVGFENMNLGEIARLVRDVLQDESVEIEKQPSTDQRSYHVNSGKISRVLNFKPRFTINQAISSLVVAHTSGHIKKPLENSLYYNIRRMNELRVK